MIRVLVVDDSATVRALLVSILGSAPASKSSARRETAWTASP